MKIRKPDYYDRFHCIAGACSDSCCIGWEIDVDEERREFYRKVDGPLGERLHRCIDWEEGHFILQGKEERCPFLNGENLCDLIIGLGEESLCDICREHPRYYEWYEDLTEAGVGLCCEAAAKLILESEEPAKFVETWETEERDFSGDSEEEDDSCGCEEGEESCECEDIEDSRECEDEDMESGDEDADDTLDVLFDARDTAYHLLQNRSVSIWTRLRTFMNYIEELQQALDFENLDELEESSEYYRQMVLEECECVSGDADDSYGAVDAECSEDFEVSEADKARAYQTIIEFCKQLEPIDEQWPKRLEKLEALTADAKAFCKLDHKLREEYKSRDHEYENLAVYLVYRYFMKCRFDADVYSRGCLTVFLILLVRLLEMAEIAESGETSTESRTIHAKDCSKEIEYSEENLAILADLFWEHGFEEILAGL